MDDVRPAGRASAVTTTPGGVPGARANHFAITAGSIQALKTRSGGAWNVRRILTRASACAWRTWRLLSLGEKRGEVVELLLPERFVKRNPVGGLLKRRGLQAALPHTAGLGRGDEAGVGEHAQVLHDRWHRHPVRRGEVADRRVAGREPREDRAARRIGERAERRVEARRILNHKVKYY